MVYEVTYVVIHVREKETDNIRLMPIGSSILAIWGTLASHDTQTCYLGPTLCYVLISHFYHGLYFVAIPDQGVV